MLVEFSLENYRSIKERITFSMLATTDQTLPGNTFAVSAWDKDRFVKTAFLYGPNASGKTNVILALHYLRFLLVTSEQRNKGDKLADEAFVLDEGCAGKPSSFEVRFVVEEIPYTYGVTVDTEKVWAEYLYYAPQGRKSVIFERTEDRYKFTVDKDRQTAIAQNTISNRLYLASATNANYDKTEPAFRWIKSFLRIRIGTDMETWQNYTNKCISDGGPRAEKIQQFIQKADFGIQRISARNSIVSEDMLHPDTPGEIRKKLIGQEYPEVFMHHQAKTKTGTATIALRDESKGTRATYEFAGPLFDVLENGYTFLIDEIESSLHPHIVQEIIRLFHDPACNPKNAQLICTTHATAFLNRELLRRDQIWFTQKDPELGMTELFSLSELRGIRKDENYEKSYWAGRYGAIPFFGNGLIECRQEM